MERKRGDIFVLFNGRTGRTLTLQA